MFFDKYYLLNSKFCSFFMEKGTIMLKNDWTLAHFLCYLSAFMIIGVIAQFVTFHLPYIVGYNSIQSIASVDPPIAIDADYFGLEKKRIQFEDGSVFTIGSEVYAYASYYSDDNVRPEGSMLTLSIRILKFACLLIFYLMLNQILVSLTKKNPFDKRNVRRLYTMGLSLIGIHILHIIQAGLLSNYLNKIFTDSDLAFEPGFFGSQGSILFGLVIILLGYVFKEANRIHEELKLTV